MAEGYNKRSIGTKAEEQVAEFLAGQGMQIIVRNFRSRNGEIDIIGRHNGYLVFLEVKYRSTMKKGTPEEAVGLAKQKTICRVADYYRCTRGVPLSTPIRYDVVTMTGEEIHWYQNAFPHIYR